MPVSPLPLSKTALPAQGWPVGQPTPRVFICDDDLAFAEEMSRGLAALGFRTATLAGEQKPVRAIKAFNPDVVLLDIFMPEPNGFEILNQVIEEPALRALPYILMSGTDTGLLDVAHRFCTGHKLRVAGIYQKPLRIAEVSRACRLAATSAYATPLADG